MAASTPAECRDHTRMLRPVVPRVEVLPAAPWPGGGALRLAEAVGYGGLSAAARAASATARDLKPSPDDAEEDVLR